MSIFVSLPVTQPTVTTIRPRNGLGQPFPDGLAGEGGSDDSPIATRGLIAVVEKSDYKTYLQDYIDPVQLAAMLKLMGKTVDQLIQQSEELEKKNPDTEEWERSLRVNWA